MTVNDDQTRKLQKTITIIAMYKQSKAIMKIQTKWDSNDSIHIMNNENANKQNEVTSKGCQGCSRKI